MNKTWDNTMSAEVCDGKTPKSIKKYFLNSYKAMLEIFKEVK